MKGYQQFKRVALGCDHGAFALKERIKEYLIKKGMEVEDIVPGYESPIPYVSVARDACKKVLSREGTLGILACGTGAGMAIASNRIIGIHASLLYDDFTAEYSRRHTNANVLVFGGRTMRPEDVFRRIDLFLSHEFEGGKYAERNRIMDEPYVSNARES